MKSLFALLTLLFLSLGIQAQKVTLQDVAQGTYRAQNIYGLKPMLDGEHYTQISSDHKRIVKYSFKTGKEVEAIFDVTKARDCNFKTFDDYILSPDEKLILIQTETKPIYRHSFTAVYYIYNVKNNTLEPLSNNGPQQVPLFSPDGNQIAFVRNNNIFLVKLLFGNSESQVTKDGEYNKVLNGIPDWVYEEEFSFNRAFDFSADSKMIAYIRFDESQVPMFSFPWYKGMAPAKEDYTTYPGKYEYKYPKAGETNSTVTVHTYDIKSHVTRQMDLPLDKDGYIPRIKFTSDPEKLAIMTLNRHQNRFDLYLANPRSATCKVAIRDEAEQYIKEQEYGSIAFYPNHIVLMSERDGYNHLYLYTIAGNLVRQITKGNFEVTDFLGYDEANGTTYYASNEGSPLRTAIYKIDSKGKKTKLSTKEGTNNALFSKNFAYFINTYSSKDTPTEITLNDSKGRELVTLLDNKQLKSQLTHLNMPTKEFFTFKTSQGVELNGWMMKPANFDPNKKYPVIMHQYSGPGSQQVLDKWGIGSFGDGGMFEAYMCDKGYIMVCVDGRGTGGRGAAFEKCTYLFLGVKESEDQVETARYLGTLPYVDGSRIGIWGWSFGGYNTLMSMSDGSGAFKAGVAIAAPSDWRFYDTVYTERFMRTPKENGDGYNAGSAISRASKLQGKLLLIHGTADDNVHYQNAAEYSEALVQANKQFDMQVYTNRNHSIFGGNTRNHLMNRVANFFLENL
ncbi:S9 family peptidase [Phocaeicola barnesiae]|uniref:S9 family peptidase n=1 Tax=Phocaeicola barnesiae TaxID=376804 RepID=A0AAW5N4Y5_9BACT|nr:S9 family peptidase [Phocaeicola barnesiae]MBS6468756.1 S9 family peptidase [Bacteroides sp.]CDD32403.1 peptidase S9A/B/C family catalytic domain protein [Bacteroides sp. CAG:714]MCF2574862.1 S9 family peptidase [Phocaeicola barnesiae]MCF2597410.1 S9 family peptidase [Phocaeicola barnesiae]MCR8873112.1 S9 family peptidase [Phocaeicola barnesiae]